MINIVVKKALVAIMLIACAHGSPGLSAQAAEREESLPPAATSPEPSIDESGPPEPPNQEPAFRFEQSIGLGYSSDRGFLALYRIDAQGSFFSLTNDFAFKNDRLALTLRQRFDLTDFLSVTAEVPTTLDWELKPSRLDFGYAVRGKVNIHSRRDQRDNRPGWSLWAEAAVQANGEDGLSGSITNYAPDLLSSSPTSRYRAGGIVEATFFNDLLTPSLNVSSYFDVDSATLTDVMVSASLAHDWGSRDRTTKLSLAVPLVDSKDSQALDNSGQVISPAGASTRLVLEQNWGRLMGKVEYSTIGTMVMFGYKF